MVIEFSLLENFFMAIVIVALFVILVILIKHAMKKKPIHEEVTQQPDPKSDAQYHSTMPHHQEETDSQDYRYVLRAAQKHAKTLLYHSSIAASDMMIGAKKTNEHLEEDLDKVLQGIAASDIHTLKSTTSKFDEDYKKALENIQKQLQEITATVVQNSKTSYNEKMDEFTKDLLKNGLATQSEVDKKTAELLTKAEAEIEEYKKSKLNKVDEEITQLIQRVYRDVLRVSIPENVHQEMIVKSLEEAKKDGMFKL